MSNESQILITFIEKNLDVDIGVLEKSFLMRALEKRKAELKIIDTAGFCNWMKDNPAEAEAFVQSLKIQYTDFFRESLTFSYLEKIVLPGIIGRAKEGKELRIWSAGCSSGQEPYSVAMLLSNLAETASRKFRFRIFATDHSEAALERAKTGLYDHDSVGNLKVYQLEKYFIKRDRFYSVTPQLRNHIDFSFYDILDKSTGYPTESIYGDFDLVLCCNLIFYYNHENKKFIIRKLMNSLAPGGFLITGDVEKGYVESIVKQKACNISAPVFQKCI